MPAGIYDFEPRSIAVMETHYTLRFRAMHAAEDVAVLLDPMPDDAVAAMRAGRRKRLNRALK